MELRHLRYFVAIAEEGHITRAALRLGLQQPPLSQQLLALEAEIGAALFIRGPRGVSLTKAGEAFLPGARASLGAADTATRDAQRAAAGLTGALELGYTTSTALHPAIPPVIRGFGQANPGVKLGITEGNARELTDQVAAGRLDVALVRVPVGVPAGLVVHELLREPAYLALPAGHPLLGRWRPGSEGPALHLRSLANDRFILVRQAGAPGLYENLLVSCRRAGFEPQVVAQVERMLTNLNLVAAGIGVTIVPASMRSIHLGQVAYCAIRDRPLLQAPVTLLHRADAAPTVGRFLALARQQVASFNEDDGPAAQSTGS